ncbi:MAG: helicase-related protein [Beijerinckiaceae bacterium]|nr:helicase-related protein [Beijerinckiaceae bacterium]
MNLPFSAHPTVRHDRLARERLSTVSVVLGPTNTGKTHFAIERLLSHRSGMIGLPLRLLAREVYNRVVEKVGSEAVALVTGEEKIKPKGARYWICTVEAMPRDLDLAFVAIDEIQLAADLDRGHVFTDRILHRRGLEETLLIGASTMQQPLQALLPDARIVSRPRLSKLTFAGEKKIARLPRRSAIVAFSAEEVYAIAEWLRRQKGGAAVVLGALSPRTRNAQIDMYQNGDVDYIVATDAIGMGLNLDVDHIAFAAGKKFDGWQHRPLTPAEFGQIAGRAGRHLRDGTFGTTGRCDSFGNELVEMLEDHRFDPVRMLQWRNTDLDMASLDALAATLDVLPGEPGLTRAPLAQDQLVLEIAARDSDVRKVARNRGDVARLWECCQIPDYRKLSPAAHAELVLTVYGFVVRAGRIPDDWFARHVEALDRTDGDLDSISARIAQVRTWTFIANRPDWLRDPEHWQGVTRRVEDSLSDALHERLAQRFVDRRTSVLMRRLRENAMLEAEITSSGDVMVEGQHVGHLNGFRFTPDPQASGEAAKALNAAALKALASEIESRALRVHEAVDEAFVLANDGLIRWLGEPVGRLAVGTHILEPQIRIIADEQLTGPALEQVQRRLDLWIAQHVKKLLGPLTELEKSSELEGIAKGIAFQIAESLGVLERGRVAEEVKNLAQDARATLRKLGVRFGAYHLYLPALVKPAPRALAAQLWALKNGGVEGVKGLDEVPHLASSGRTSFVADPSVQKGFYRAAGFRVCGERAVRVDILERLADLIRPAIAYRPGTTPGEPPAGAADNEGFVVTVGMTSLAGCSGEAFASILKSLGYVLDRRAGPAITVPLVPKASTEPVQVIAAPEPPPAAEAAPHSEHGTGPSEAATEEHGTAPETAPVPEAEAAPATEPVPEVEPAPEPVPETVAAAPETAPEAPPAEDVAPTVVADETAPAVEASAETQAPEAAAAPVAEAATAEAEAPAEPVEIPLIEVWRPHRQNVHNRRPAGDRAKFQGRRDRGPTNQPQAALGDVPAEGGAAPSSEEAPKSNRPERSARYRRPEGEGYSRPAGGDSRAKGGGGERSGGPGRPHGGDARRDAGHGGKPRRDERVPSFQTTEKPKSRDRAPDPDSPFAKLAALKEQMEKDRR